VTCTRWQAHTFLLSDDDHRRWVRRVLDPFSHHRDPSHGVAQENTVTPGQGAWSTRPVGLRAPKNLIAFLYFSFGFRPQEFRLLLDTIERVLDSGT
jgi:hypothetical protein